MVGTHTYQPLTIIRTSYRTENVKTVDVTTFQEDGTKKSRVGGMAGPHESRYTRCPASNLGCHSCLLRRRNDFLVTRLFKRDSQMVLFLLVFAT